MNPYLIDLNPSWCKGHNFLLISFTLHSFHSLFWLAAQSFTFLWNVLSSSGSDKEWRYELPLLVLTKGSKISAYKFAQFHFSKNHALFESNLIDVLDIFGFV